MLDDYEFKKSRTRFRDIDITRRIFGVMIALMNQEPEFIHKALNMFVLVAHTRPSGLVPALLKKPTWFVAEAHNVEADAIEDLDSSDDEDGDAEDFGNVRSHAAARVDPISLLNKNITDLVNKHLKRIVVMRPQTVLRVMRGLKYVAQVAILFHLNSLKNLRDMQIAQKAISESSLMKTITLVLSTSRAADDKIFTGQQLTEIEISGGKYKTVPMCKT
jgi:hypothetical protein